MQINTNVAALMGQRQLDRSQTEVSRSLQRLSSGLRINSAKDDAAGLAISERMTAQVRGFTQARRNANDGISMLQTAEGALSTLGETLQRIRELSVQAANASNSQSDRKALQAEVNQLLSEVDRIGTETQFNGEKIFSQATGAISGDPNESTVMDALKLGWLENAEKMVRDYYGLAGDGAAMDVKLVEITDPLNPMYNALAWVGWTGTDGAGLGTGLSLTVNMKYYKPPTLPNGGAYFQYADRTIAHEMVHATMLRSFSTAALGSDNEKMWFIEGSAELINGGDERLKSAIGAWTDPNIQAVVDTVDAWVNDSAHYAGGYAAMRYLHDKLKGAGFGGGVKDFMAYLDSGNNKTLDQAMKNFFGGAYSLAQFKTDFKADGVNFIKTKMDLNNADVGAIGGFDADAGEVMTAESVVSDQGTVYGDDVLSGFTENYQKIGGNATDVNTLGFQVGAEAKQTIDVRVGAVNSRSLGISDVDLEYAQFAIVRIDRALDFVNAQRANLGAQISRFESAIGNLDNSNININAARSRIRDADFASETTTLTRAQILQQAGTAMLAQAGATQQLALQLLR